MQSQGCNRCRARQIQFLFHSPVTQMNEKYWSSSFLISILSQNFDKEWNVRKFDLDFYIFSMKNIKQTNFNMFFNSTENLFTLNWRTPQVAGWPLHLTMLLLVGDGNLL